LVIGFIRLLKTAITCNCSAIANSGRRARTEQEVVLPAAYNESFEKEGYTVGRNGLFGKLHPTLQRENEKQSVDGRVRLHPSIPSIHEFKYTRM
jgi:hypothetical protein